jgi:hypothetical protein
VKVGLAGNQARDKAELLTRKNGVYAKTKKEASKRSFERIVRRSFHFIGSFKFQKSVKLPN